MIVITLVRWFWWFLGVAAAAYVAWKAGAMIGWALGWCTWPEVSGMWTWLSFTAGAFWMAERSVDEFRDLMRR